MRWDETRHNDPEAHYLLSLIDWLNMILDCHRHCHWCLWSLGCLCSVLLCSALPCPVAYITSTSHLSSLQSSSSLSSSTIIHLFTSTSAMSVCTSPSLLRIHANHCDTRLARLGGRKGRGSTAYYENSGFTVCCAQHVEVLLSLLMMMMCTGIFSCPVLFFLLFCSTQNRFLSAVKITWIDLRRANLDSIAGAYSNYMAAIVIEPVLAVVVVVVADSFFSLVNRAQ